MSQGVNDSWNLIWTPYQGFDYSTYFIMRKSGEGAYEQIATVSASFTSFTDLNAPAGEVSYMVGVTHPTGCNPVNRDGEIQQVFSNIATNSAVQVNEMTASGFNVYPNPASESTRVTLVSNEQSSVKITLNDITGRTVWTQTYKTNGSTMTATIDLSAYREGMYILTADSGKERKSTRIVINR
jgi:hypothetical protein